MPGHPTTRYQTTRTFSLLQKLPRSSKLYNSVVVFHAVPVPSHGSHSKECFSPSPPSWSPDQPLSHPQFPPTPWRSARAPHTGAFECYNEVLSLHGQSPLDTKICVRKHLLGNENCRRYQVNLAKLLAAHCLGPSYLPHPSLCALHGIQCIKIVQRR